MGHRLLRSLIGLIFFLGFQYSHLEAAHIVGGNIVYECLGNDRYLFTLRVYRDCNCTDCAELDPEANIGIYRCDDENGGCNGQGQNTTYGRFAVPLARQGFITTPDYPCLIEPDICVEEGVYFFEVTLPDDGIPYHISYQRCCRNRTINNVIDPGGTGSTYSIKLDTFAQRVCNSSPVFNTFPPTVICGGSPLSYDHSAVDADGDQLVYEFCAPFQGGGPQTMPFNTLISCVGARPEPACPPPYFPVSFRPPLYSAETPMSGDPAVTINPNTGEITGIPNIQGQFVVGVCVSEFRDGQLLSRVFRDFQFNVENCDPEVVADLRKDILIEQRVFGVNSCGSVDVFFENQSFQEAFIDDYVWSFDIDGTEQQFTDWSPTVTFPGVGQYTGSLILNPNTQCGDTAFILVNVFPDLEADFSYEYDTCVAGEVAFTDESRTGAGFLVEWDWEFGDGGSSEEQNPAHLYREPGVIPVTLSIRDTNQCVESVTKDINYFPVPAILLIAPSAFDGCAPVDIFFNNLSFPIDTTYDIRWNFGDGGRSGAISPTYTYNDPGLFTVDLSVTSPIGCTIDTVFPDLISVLESPEAGFSFAPDEPSILDPVVSFFDESARAVGYRYDFGDGSFDPRANPIHTYQDTGRYLVRQTVTHPNGCIDTAFQLVDVKPEVRYFLPNAFTPNNDGLNDTYKGVGIMAGATNFTMSIWNRWGQQIFLSNDPQQGWNGRMFNSGGQAPNGVYVVQVNFDGPRGEKFEYKAFATLIR